MALSRGARFILTFILAAVIVSMTGIAMAYFFATRGPSVEINSVLWLRVPANLGEREPDDVFGQLLGRRDTVGSVVDALRKAKVDDRVAAVVLVPPFQPGLWGKTQEIREAVLDFRESDKPIVAYLEYGGGQAYYLATAADRILLTPTSPLDLVGVASYDLFLRNALDKIGIYPDMLNAGDYKTASNLYEETTFTPEHREMSESLNRDFYDQLVAGIAEGRTMTEPMVRDLIDEGPFLASEAVNQGLIDGLVYEDELIAGLRIGDDDPPRLEFASYRQVDAGSLGLNRGPRIAVVYAEGGINLGSSGVDLQGTMVMGSRTMAQAIRAARDDDSIRAIVLRIDSPGGAAIAADLIWREVMLAREEKPVIASMSDLGASGGYYIAAPAHAIVAQPGTLTGSIGVFGGKFALGGTFEKLGVNMEAVSDGQQAELYSPVTPFSEEGRAEMQIQVDAIYERFLETVADGRGMTRDAVHAVAQGRVWTGRQAKANHLVDELGGLRRAVALAKEWAGIDADREVTLVAYPRPRTFFEALNSPFAIRSAVAAGWFPSPYARLLEAAVAPVRLFRPGEPLMLMPYLNVN